MQNNKKIKEDQFYVQNFEAHNRVVKGIKELTKQLKIKNAKIKKGNNTLTKVKNV